MRGGDTAIQAQEAADSAVVARARRGDRAAFDQLYVKHRDRVYTLCLNLCGDRDRAEDLLQETFVRAYRALPGFRGRSRFTTWLHRIAVNLCHETARRSRRRADPPTVAADANTEVVDNVRAALMRLRPQHRVVLVLRYHQSLSYREIAEVLNWSLARVKVTLHRAKRAFKDAYLKLDDCEP
ncbi:MAG: RNA polymerase sigma factor [Armatimonadota bacterium]|nr:MAG: RNA polymerase sigma factor [Armatimonadota bacterium]